MILYKLQLLIAAVVAQSVKCPELKSLKEVKLIRCEVIPGRGIGVREKILAMPPVGVGGKVEIIALNWLEVRKAYSY